MPGITQSMGGSDSKSLKHCIKRGKGKGPSYIQQKTKNMGGKYRIMCKVLEEAAQTMHSTVYKC